jgi:3',5'-cyclic AMP phosphodiesterase CpdA
MVFSLAHLSDLHLPLPGAVSFRPLAIKQALALMAWRRKRRRPIEPEPQAALLADLAAHAPGHMAVTGDLINLAVASEFDAARAWLAHVAAPDRLSVVPGNHDLTVARPWPEGIGRWDEWMRGDPGTQAGNASDPANGGAPFPFLRRRGPLALIGLSSAIATPVGFADGRLGEPQLRRLAGLLHQAGREGLFRVVLIHHPPVIGEGGWRKALRDRAALCAVLARCGAELVLHGHHHVTRLVALPGPDGPIPVCGVPHALGRRRAREAAGWRFYEIARQRSGWRVTSHGRRYNPVACEFQPSGTWTLQLSRPASGPGEPTT